MLVGVRPQAIAPISERSSDVARFPARVFLTEPLGDVTILDIVAGGDHRLKMILPQERAFGIEVETSDRLRYERARTLPIRGGNRYSDSSR